MKNYNLFKKSWGLNKKKLKLILGFLGITNSFIMDDLPKNIIIDLEIILSNYSKIGYSKYKIFLSKKIQLLSSLKLKKGFYRIKGLPVRGQRIKTNAKTQKKLFRSRII